METLGGVFTRLIDKNTTIPTSKSQIFSTAADNQTSVEIHILQGEREMAADNKTLARFILDGLPPAPRGRPQVEVSFDIDANGILNVKASDKATGKSQSVRIEASTSLNKEEVERLKNEAAKYADEDKVKREMIEVKNKAENLIYTSEKALRDAGDKVPAQVKEEITAKVDALKKVLPAGGKAGIESAINDLSATIEKIGESMYGGDKASENKADGGENGKKQ